MLLFCLLLAGYLVLRVALPLKCRWYWRLAAALVLTGASLKFHIFRFFGGPRFFAPELPRWMLIAGSWCFAVVFVLFFLLLLADLIHGLWVLIKFTADRKKPVGFRRRSNIISGAMAAAAMLIALFGMFSGFSPPEVRRTELVIPGLPPEMDGLSIAVLADIHIDGCTLPERLPELVRRTNAAAPDIIVLPGDMVDGRVDELGRLLEPLTGLKAKYGVFGSPGNHEYYSGYAGWMAFFAAHGVRMLVNSNIVLSNGAVIAGVADPNGRRFGFAGPDFRQALEGTGGRPLIIMLSHQPKFAPEAAGAGADLIISGHTHGGMMPGFDRIVAAFNGGFVSGIYRVDGSWLAVSNGAGIWSGFPVRLGRPAEIPLLILRSPEKHDRISPPEKRLPSGGERR